MFLEFSWIQSVRVSSMFVLGMYSYSCSVPYTCSLGYCSCSCARSYLFSDRVRAHSVIVRVRTRVHVRVCSRIVFVLAFTSVFVLGSCPCLCLYFVSLRVRADLHLFVCLFVLQ